MEKSVQYLLITIGGGIGAYLPTLFGQSSFGGWSIIGSLVGGFIAIYFIFKLNN